jgi:hypothetical protein
MKKPNPKIIKEFLDAFIASGETTISAKEIVRRTEVSQHNISCIFQNLKARNKYNIVATVDGKTTNNKIGVTTQAAALVQDVLASTNIIKAWANIAQNPKARIFIPAFWPVLGK